MIFDLETPFLRCRFEGPLCGLASLFGLRPTRLLARARTSLRCTRCFANALDGLRLRPRSWLRLGLAAAPPPTGCSLLQSWRSVCCFAARDRARSSACALAKLLTRLRLASLLEPTASLVVARKASPDLRSNSCWALLIDCFAAAIRAACGLRPPLLVGRSGQTSS